MTNHQHKHHTHRRRRLRHSAPGVPPGTLVPDPKAPFPAIRVLSYGPDEVEDVEVQEPSEMTALIGQRPVTWISIQGLGDAETIERVGEILRLHSLALEDVVNVHQRPRADQYGDTLFIVLRMVHLAEHMESEQVSLFLAKDFVVSFQEGKGNGLDAIRERITLGRGQIRRQGADYLAYALIDAIIDGYFPLIEVFGERLDDLEEEVLEKPSRSLFLKVHEIKRELLERRRIVWPLRELVNDLIRDPNPLISNDTRTHLKDCYDHVVQIIDLVETDREICADLMELHLTAVSNRMNEVMTVLAIIATVFMPMTFISGIYGMNLHKEGNPWAMPEINFYYAYPVVLMVMAASGLGLLWYCRRRGWFDLYEVPKDREK